MNLRRALSVVAVIWVLRTVGCGGDSPEGERDERLVGAWRHTDAYVSGEFSAAVDDYLWLEEDGTYREGGNAAAGDMGASLVSGESVDADGTWRTEDRVLYVMPSGGDEWIAVANYSASDSNLLFTFGDGSKKIWERM